ncbi:MAG: response regulator [Clostridiaceae bacterium]
MENDQIKVFIADDHSLIREGLRRIVSYEEDIIVVGEAKNGEEALEKLKNENANVLLLDFNMPGINGLEVLKKVKKENKLVSVIMITIEDDMKTIHNAIDNGADGYMLKDSLGEEIVEAIRTVYKNGKYIDKSLVPLLFQDIKNEKDDRISVLDNLSKRELDVFLNISKGFSNKEIGAKLFISEKTVKNYATNIFRKINVYDRVHATIFAIENKLELYYNEKFK